MGDDEAANETEYTDFKDPALRLLGCTIPHPAVKWFLIRRQSSFGEAKTSR
jgi:hypothetical protein